MLPPRHVGRVVFGVALAGLGATNFIYREGVLNLEPVPNWVPARPALAFLTGAVLVIGGLILASGRFERTASTVLAALLSVWLVFLQLPPLVSAAYNGGLWTTTLEVLALCSAAWVLATAPSTAARVARIVFGVTLFGFASLHVIYEAYVTSVIPALFLFPKFWTYATAAAFAAAGVALVSGLRARLAATLLGAMFGSWVLLVHVPRVLGSPTVRAEWTSLLICLAMSGAGLLVASSPEPPRAS